MNKLRQISGFIFFIAVIGLIVLLAVSSDASGKRKVTSIKIDGNRHLSKEEYLKFADLVEPENLENIDLTVIKKRFEKHPYVKRADVKFDNVDEVYVILHEKNFISLMNCDGKEYLLSSENEVIPVIQKLQNINYPFVENPDVKSSDKFIDAKQNKDIKTAYMILETAELLNHEFYKDISEINLRNGKDILLYFSSLDFPVIIGRNNEVRKLVYFNKLWSKLKDRKVEAMIDYIDLRFNDKMYLKIAEGSLEQKEQKI